MRRRSDGVVAEIAVRDLAGRHRVGGRTIAGEYHDPVFVADDPAGGDSVDGDAGDCLAAVGIGQRQGVEEADTGIFRGRHRGDRHVAGDRRHKQVERDAVGQRQWRCRRRIAVGIAGAQCDGDAIEVTAEIGSSRDADRREACLRGFEVIPRGVPRNRVGTSGSHRIAVHEDRAVTGRIGDDDVAPLAAIEILEGRRKQRSEIERRILADRHAVRAIAAVDTQVDRVGHGEDVVGNGRRCSHPGHAR